MKKDPSTLMLYTVMKNLKGLGYLLKVILVNVLCIAFVVGSINLKTALIC